MRNFKRWVKGFLVIAALIIVFGSMPLQGEAASPKLNKTSVTLKVGKSVRLKVKGTKKKVKWSSTKKKVCTVSAKGFVKAKKKGTATIKAKVGKKTLKCKVKVKAAKPAHRVKATGLKIKGASNVLAPGGTMQLSVKFLPANARAEAVTWGVSDSYYASVSNGLVKAGSREKDVEIYAWLDADNDGYLDSGEISASYSIRIKDITATGEVNSADGGDLLLTDSNARAILSFAMSDTVAGVVVNVQDSTEKVVRAYSMGTLGAGVETTCTWDLKDSRGAKVAAGSYRFEIQAAGASLRSGYFNVYAKSDFGVGNGSPSSPYKISNLEQLKMIVMHNGRCFEQTKDIDANMGSLPSLFTNDAPFTGEYDGKNFEIKNIVNFASADYYALFGGIGTEGKVKNITLSGCSFSGGKYVAALVAYNKGTIDSCKVNNCNITSSDLYAAALCAYNSGNIMNSLTSNNNVISQGGSWWRNNYNGSNSYDSFAGAICSWNDTSVLNCESTNDTISALYNCVGGVAGYNAGIIASCKITDDTLFGDSNVGGITGNNYGTVSGCIVNDQKNLISVSYCGLGGVIGWNCGTNSNNAYYGSLSQTGYNHWD